MSDWYHEGFVEAECPECRVQMRLQNFRYGTAFFCEKCDIKWYTDSLGRPRGKPANRETRQARMDAHSEFDKLWKNGHMSRRRAYKWLQQELGVPREQCHMKEMDAATCRRVQALVLRKFQEIRQKSAS